MIIVLPLSISKGCFSSFQRCFVCPALPPRPVLAQLAPPFVLPPAQALWVSLMCGLGRLLETQLAPMALAASSPK